MLALVAWRYAPPSPRGAETPPQEFSAVRAKAALARVLGDGTPHLTGTPANAAVRARLIAELERLGLKPEVEEGFVCGGGGRCAQVVNVLARVPGDSPEGAALLACHYDSVASGPGAADDGAGVATALETARALLASPRLARDVWLLIDDGEEQALLGAEAFVLDAARAKRFIAVVNVEARGTTGPSLMFELSTGSAWLVGEAARVLPRPATNSIYYTLYQRLPNDTDLTVFKRHGMAGVNFAFVGGPLRYHTRRDDLDHLDLGSLQHHGDHALAMVRSLAGPESSWRRVGEAVFFDVLTLFVVRWPQPWTLPLALLGAVMVIVAVWLRRRRDGGGGGAAWGAAAALGAIVVAAALGWLLRWSLKALGALPYQWVAHSWPLTLAFWAAAFAAVGLVVWLAGDRVGPRGAWAATWIGWSLLAVAAAALAPGVSYPLVVPVLVAGVAGLGATLARAGNGWSWLPPLVAAAVVIFPMAWMLYDGMGDGALPGVTILIALVLTAALPAFAAAARRQRLLLAAAGGAAVLVGAVAALALPKFTADSPQPLSLVLYLDADRGESRWVAGSTAIPLPPSLAALRAMRGPYPWAPELEAWTASAPRFDAPPPEVTIEAVTPSANEMHVRVRLRSLRGAPIAGVYAPSDRLTWARLGGEEVPLSPEARRGEWATVENVTLGTDGALIELLFTGTDPVEIHAYDVQPGLPDKNAPLLRARPEWAVPLGRGDRSIVSRRVRIAAER
ncbi:MAG TPA: M28 family peptidase [Thermoanaerobaculia bacterium]|nr:M28 family peptidase [Thermoanaerobaculia bacterium]